MGAQVQVVGSEVVRWPIGRTSGFGSLQGRLDDPCDTDRNLVLQFENVFERAVEAIGPKMRAGLRLDQLRGDPHATASFAHRTFQHIADTEFAPYLLHVDSLALVGEARV